MATLQEGRVHWQAAFVAYCNGAPEDEIAQIFNIPLTKLRNRMLAENWAALRGKLPLATTGAGNQVPEAGFQLPAAVNAKLKLIEENRLTNYEAFADARDHAVAMVRALKNGDLKLEKVFYNTKTGDVKRITVNPGPGDWVNIATYLNTIANGTYRALGDFQSQEKPASDAPAGATIPSAPAITIILPGAIARPRDHEDKKAEVIDLQDAGR